MSMMRIRPSNAIGVILAWLALLQTTGPSPAQPISFKGKRVMMVIGNAAGGQTDLVGRVLADSLAAHLPGRPQVVVVNQPGAEGVVALNVFSTQAMPDGSTMTFGAGSQSDPLFYRTAHAVYDLTKFAYVGGTAQLGTGLFVNKKAMARIRDKGAAAVTMGALTAARSGMYITLWGTEYLGWNAKWVLGYPTTPQLRDALLRGEVDMTSLGSIDDIKRIMDTGNFVILAQAGRRVDGRLVPRPELGTAPVLSTLLAGKIADPAAKKALAYWENVTQVGTWLALPPATPKPVVSAYRDAINQVFADPVFRARIGKLLPGADMMNGEAVQTLVTDLAKTPPEALDYMRRLQVKAGIVSSPTRK